jgi:hypothetical protein
MGSEGGRMQSASFCGFKAACLGNLTGAQSILPTSLKKNAADMVWAIVIAQKLLARGHSLFQV